MRILIVDDNDAYLYVLTELLRRAGHTVTSRTSSRNALAYLREASVDVVVTDIVMPEEDGLELTMQVRKEFPDIPLIVISGSSAHSGLYLKMAMKLGAAA